MEEEEQLFPSNPLLLLAGQKVVVVASSWRARMDLRFHALDPQEMVPPWQEPPGDLGLWLFPCQDQAAAWQLGLDLQGEWAVVPSR